MLLVDLINPYFCYVHELVEHLTEISFKSACKCAWDVNAFCLVKAAERWVVENGNYLMKVQLWITWALIFYRIWSRERRAAKAAKVREEAASVAKSKSCKSVKSAKSKKSAKSGKSKKSGKPKKTGDEDTGLVLEYEYEVNSFISDLDLEEEEELEVDLTEVCGLDGESSCYCAVDRTVGVKANITADLGQPVAQHKVSDSSLLKSKEKVHFDRGDGPRPVGTTPALHSGEKLTTPALSSGEKLSKATAEETSWNTAEELKASRSSRLRASGENWTPQRRDSPRPSAGSNKPPTPPHSTGSVVSSRRTLESVDDSEIGSLNRRSVMGEPIDPSAAPTLSHEVLPYYPKTEEEEELLTHYVAKIFFLWSMEEMALRKVVGAMRRVEAFPGDVIIRQGDEGDYFYVVETGVFEASRKNARGNVKTLRLYENGGSFGEIALLHNCPRLATVSCLEPGVLWALDRETFSKVVIQTAYEKRKLYDELLSKVPILDPLTESERQQLVDALVPKTYGPGVPVVTQDDVADGMHFILEGQARVVYVDEKEVVKELKMLTVGDYFGELALITSKPRAASVISHGPLRTAFLEKGAFERLLGPYLDILSRNFEQYDEERRN